MRLIVHEVVTVGVGLPQMGVPLLRWPGAGVGGAAATPCDPGEVAPLLCDALTASGLSSADDGAMHLVVGPASDHARLEAAVRLLHTILAERQRMSLANPIDSSGLLVWSDSGDPEQSPDLKRLLSLGGDGLDGRLAALLILGRVLPGGALLWDSEAVLTRQVSALIRVLALEAADGRQSSTLDSLHRAWQRQTAGHGMIVGSGHARWFDVSGGQGCHDSLRAECFDVWQDADSRIDRPAPGAADAADVERILASARLQGRDELNREGLFSRWLDSWCAGDVSVEAGHDASGGASPLVSVRLDSGHLAELSPSAIRHRLADGLRDARRMAESDLSDMADAQVLIQAVDDVAGVSRVGRPADALLESATANARLLHTQASSEQTDLRRRIGDSRVDAETAGVAFDAAPYLCGIAAAVDEVSAARARGLSLKWWLPHVIVLGACGAYPAVLLGRLVGSRIGFWWWIPLALWAAALCALTAVHLFRDRSLIAGLAIAVTERIEGLRAELRRLAALQVEAARNRLRVRAFRHIGSRAAWWLGRQALLRSEIARVRANPPADAVPAPAECLASLWMLARRVREVDIERWRREAWANAVRTVSDGVRLALPTGAEADEWGAPDPAAFNGSLARIRERLPIPMVLPSGRAEPTESTVVHLPTIALEAAQRETLLQAIGTALTGREGGPVTAALQMVQGGRGLGYGVFVFGWLPSDWHGEERLAEGDAS